MKKIITLLLLTVMACAVMLPVFATDVSFTVYSEDEKNYIHSEVGAWDTGTHRCHDNESYTIYAFPIDAGDTHAQLTMRIRNQYKVSVTNTNPDDPAAYEVVGEAKPTQQEIDDQIPYWGDHEAEATSVYDLSKWCENNTTGKIWVKISDAEPTNGWGALIYKDTPITFWSGTTEAPAVEEPKSEKEIAAEKIIASFKFPEGAQYFIVGTSTEKPYLYSEGGWINETNDRYHDNEAYTIYAFDVKATDARAILHGAFNFQYDIRATMGDPDDLDSYTQIAVAEPNEVEIDAGDPWWGYRIYTEDVLDENGNVVNTITHYPVMELDLSSVLNGKDGKLYVYIGDCAKENGWGGQVLFNEPVVFVSAGAPTVTPTETPEETPAETPEDAPAVEDLVITPIEKVPATSDPSVIAALLTAISALGAAVTAKKKH